MSTEKEVAIVGGGLAGLTCALRLLEHGYTVTLYEKEEMLGGDISSERRNGMDHDVYPHLFCDWYRNFWHIVEDLGIDRSVAFEYRESVKMLEDPDRLAASRRSPDSRLKAGAEATAQAAANAGGTTGAHGAYIPAYRELKIPNTLKNIWDNFISGALSPPDMLLTGFALIDLASQPEYAPVRRSWNPRRFASPSDSAPRPFHRTNVLEQQTVNGFLYSRNYMTKDSADLLNTILMAIWSIPSNDTSADAFKDFLNYMLGNRALPFAWVAKGSHQEMLIAPWRKRLESKGCKIRTSVEVKKIELGAAGRVELSLSEGKQVTQVSHANVVLAVPAPELARLVATGRAGRRLVERVPEFAELRRLRAERILVVNLFFKDKLPDIPKEHVGLAESKGYTTFIDISQLWDSLKGIRDKHTVLTVAASDAHAFPTESAEEWGHMLAEELARYLPAVKPGKHWGASDSNIDYERSCPLGHHPHLLFLNDVNSEEWQPRTSYEGLASVFLAGDYCVNEVKMATVEAAVLSGLHAARAVHEKTVGQGKSDIQVIPGVTIDSAELAAVKLALLPFAYGAKAWSAVNVALHDAASGDTPNMRSIAAPLTTLALIPLKYTADWIATLEALGVGLLAPGEKPHSARSVVRDSFTAAARGLAAAQEHVRDRAVEGMRRQPAEEPGFFRALLTTVLEAANSATSDPMPSRRTAADRRETLRSAIAEGSSLLGGSDRYAQYVRRHRGKE